MKSFKLKTIIVLILVNITTIYAVIQMENIKENKNIIIDINGNGDIFDNNFYNLIIYGPSSSVSSSAGESILYSNFKQLEQEIYNILKDEISNQFELVEYEHADTLQNDILKETQFNLKSTAYVKLHSKFNSSKKYIDHDKILKKIQQFLINKFAISKIMIEANIDNNMQELQFFIDKYSSADQSEYNNSRARDMKLTQQSLNYDKQRLIQLINRNELASIENLYNSFNLDINLKINKINKSILLETVFAYLILINSVLFIIYRYLRIKN